MKHILICNILKVRIALHMTLKSLVLQTSSEKKELYSIYRDISGTMYFGFFCKPDKSINESMDRSLEGRVVIQPRVFISCRNVLVFWF